MPRYPLLFISNEGRLPSNVTYTLPLSLLGSNCYYSLRLRWRMGAPRCYPVDDHCCNGPHPSHAPHLFHYSLPELVPFFLLLFESATFLSLFSKSSLSTSSSLIAVAPFCATLSLPILLFIALSARASALSFLSFSLLSLSLLISHICCSALQLFCTFFS